MAWKSSGVVLEEGLRQRVAGVVHQDVARAERVQRGGERGRVGDVGDGVARAEFVAGAGERGLVAPDQGDGDAVGGEAAGDGQSDALGPAVMARRPSPGAPSPPR